MASSRLQDTLSKGMNLVRSYGAVGTIGAAALAIGGSTLLSPYNKDYDLQASIDALIAPSAATLVGNYAALKEDHVGFSGGASKVQNEITSRYQEIRAAGHKGGVFDQLDDFVEQGYRDAKDGHVSVLDISFYGATILHADKKLRDYALRTQTELGAFGIEADASQSLTAGIIGTELLSTETNGDVTARKFLRKSDLPPEVADHLTANLRDVEFAVRSVHHASASSEKLIDTRRTETMKSAEMATPPSSGSLQAIASTQTRPEARPEALDRTRRIQKRIGEMAATTPVARTQRIQERARAIAASKRPVARPDKDPFETQI